MNGYGNKAKQTHKIAIRRKRKGKSFNISRSDLTSAIDEYVQAGGKITRMDDYELKFSQVITQAEDHNIWETSKTEIAGITGDHRTR